MSDYLVALVYLAFVVLGVAAPFAMSLGYVWVDSFYPQFVGRYVMGGFPVAAVMGTAAVLAYILMDRRSPPRPGLIQILTGLMAVWMTLTLLWAVAPDAAWKVGLGLQDRRLCRLHAVRVPQPRADRGADLGIHAWFGDAPHRRGHQVVPDRRRLPHEPDIVAGAVRHVGIERHGHGGDDVRAVAAVPAGALRVGAVVDDPQPVLQFLRPLCVTATIGTGARTGIVCMVVLGGLYWLQSRQKIVTGVAIAVLAVLVVVFSPSAWKDRMATIDDYKQELSALTRILVWKWTLGFVQSNPLGGSFRAYEINVIQMPPDAFNPEGWVQRGRAPHSSWFEVLMELGFPGLFMFLSICGLTLWYLRRVRKRTRGVEELAWAYALARALAMSLIVLSAGATFIGVAFQPWFWFLFASSYCLTEHVRRVTQPVKRQPGIFALQLNQPPPLAQPQRGRANVTGGAASGELFNGVTGRHRA